MRTQTQAEQDRKDARKVVALSAAATTGIGWIVQFGSPTLPGWRWWPWLVAAGAGALLTLLALLIRRRPLGRLLLAGLGLIGLGFWLATDRVPEVTPGRAWWPLILAAGAVTALAAIVFGFHRREASSGRVTRWAGRSRRNKGMASAWQILRTSSWWAVRRRARVLRPRFGELSFWQRWRVPITELATPVARVGLLRVWSPVEDVTLRVGGPRSGKTGELAGRILDAPGAVIATSTRTDLIELTGRCRRQLGQLHVFNPSGIADLKSTITFDPLSGCGDPTTALSRAADLLAGVSAPGRDGDRQFWEQQARRGLATLMHAAALGGLSMREVQAWVAAPDRAAQQVTRLLHRSPEESFERDAAQFLSTNDRTRSSICATIMPALGWLADPHAAHAAAAGDFDVTELLRTRGTVYMLGAEDAQTAPLVTALTGHIAREARRLAGFAPGGRLDPPLTLALDEAALICPIPLGNWTADMGGRNVTIHIAAQSLAQLKQRWGEDGAAAIMNNAATLLIYGGTRDADDLQAYSLLTGERDEEVPTYDQGHDLHTTSVRRVPVLSPAAISQLPFRHVAIIKRGMPTAVGTVQMAWKRRDVKRAARHDHRVEQLTHWAEAKEHALDRFGQWWNRAGDTLAPLMDRIGGHRHRRNGDAHHYQADTHHQQRDDDTDGRWS